MPLPMDGGAPSVDALVRMAESSPLGIRGLAGVAGGLLLLAGARLYRLSVVAPGILGGLLVGALLPVSDPTVQAVVAVVLAAVGGLVCHFLERVAIHAVGAVVTAGLTQATWPLVTGVGTPWWAPAAGALVGLLLFPSVFRYLLKWITSLLGALTVAWAAGWSDRLWVVALLALAGVIVQTGTGRRQAVEKEED